MIPAAHAMEAIQSSAESGRFRALGRACYASFYYIKHIAATHSRERGPSFDGTMASSIMRWTARVQNSYWINRRLTRTAACSLAASPSEEERQVVE